ncbi:MAG: hypothetical protein HYX89_00950 [Chloroflexi bacterium]|nr:hypothetical protein [Chloroflexota bacterium]
MTLPSVRKGEKKGASISEEQPIEAIDLCVPIYLNQQIVFDLLAVLEDGFSQLSTIKTSVSETDSRTSDVGASIGVSNAFALLGVSLGGQRGRAKSEAEQKEISLVRVHTPTSLFAKLRLVLIERGLLKRIERAEDVEGLASAEFVEFRAVLRNNPLVATVDSILRLMAAFDVRSDKSSATPGGGKHRKHEHGEDDKGSMWRQLEAIHRDLVGSNSLEVIGEMLDAPNMKAVISAKLDYFSDRNASEIYDGEFRVLGKVVRVVGSGTGEAVNLLRKTSFGLFDPGIFDSLAGGLEEAKKAGVRFPALVTRIEGPALQVIPISIFT